MSCRDPHSSRDSRGRGPFEITWPKLITFCVLSGWEECSRLDTERGRFGEETIKGTLKLFFLPEKGINFLKLQNRLVGGQVQENSCFLTFSSRLNVLRWQK